MTDTKLITNNIAAIRQRIARACEASGRNIKEISLMAVSKTRSAEDIAAAHAAGIIDIGENYLQEALTKMDQPCLAGLELCWHFIGPIQSNKTREIAERFDWVHSVDRLKVARRLSEQRPATLAPLNICIQVNIDDEASKSGVSATELPAFAQAIQALPQLRLRGLMAIPAATDDPSRQRRSFASLRQLEEQLKLPGLDTLSMGMSGDMDSAIIEGATIIRVGTDIFGPRKPPGG